MKKVMLIEFLVVIGSDGQTPAEIKFSWFSPGQTKTSTLFHIPSRPSSRSVTGANVYILEWNSSRTRETEYTLNLKRSQSKNNNKKENKASRWMKIFDAERTQSLATSLKYQRQKIMVFLVIGFEFNGFEIKAFFILHVNRWRFEFSSMKPLKFCSFSNRLMKKLFNWNFQ